MKPCRPTLLAAAWLALLLLVGCGPGVGGSGTGNAFVHFSASPALVCSSEIAAALNCARADGVTAAGSPVTLAEGTGVVHFADTLPEANVRVAFAANAIELDAHCTRLRFSGDWGISATADARFFGTYTDAAIREPLPASLQVQALAGDAKNRVSVTVRDGGGRIVLGPVLLERVEKAAAAPAGCQ